MVQPMPFIRLAAAAALIVILAGCANQQAQQPGGLPQTVTLRNAQTGATTTVSGATVAIVLAQREMARRNYAGAVRIMDEAIRSNRLAGNDLSAAHAMRGDAYFLGGSAARARDDWRTAAEMNPQNALALRGMAIISNMQRKFPKAMQYMARAIAASPDNPHLYITRGVLRLEERRTVPQALADFDKAVSIKPDLASAYFYRGLAHHLSGRLAQAKSDYDRALEINPGERRARQALALLERRGAPGTLQPRSRANEIVQF